MSNTQLNNKLHLKNVYQLLGEKYFIPSYQRGYRWSEIQVSELLDDIWEFSQQKAGSESAFYCLQPIVVAQDEDDERWQVVDGQQRLTTLYIILHYLEKEHLRRDLSEAYREPLYTIEYETRQGSEDFLKNIQPSSETENIDFYHIAKAYEVVTDWFKGKDFNDNNLLLRTLLAKPGDGQSVKVIWYDLSEECKGNDYAIDVFSRINIGKIPLTNAELVKALFLRGDQFQEDQASLKQLQIASEWDTIEKRLQEPDFWHFIYRSGSQKQYETRIEYIFDLMKGKNAGDEPYFTFHRFNDEFKQASTDIDRLWKEIKDYFLIFDDWFRDRELYHLIGFLVDCGHSVVTLKKQTEVEGATKTKFKTYLKQEIRKQVDCQLDQLNYGDSSKGKIRKVLLLFNIQTLLATQEADVRFPFDRYKNESWDIEHIRSQTDAMPIGSARVSWLENVLDYLSSSRSRDVLERSREYLEEIRELLQQERIDDSIFSTLYGRVCADFHEGEVEWKDELGNLAILDSTTNRSYKNALFPVKRDRIIKNDMNGVFVPICTKNAFLKFYSSSSTDLMCWQHSDAEDYVIAIGKVLAGFLPPQESRDE